MLYLARPSLAKTYAWWSFTIESGCLKRTGTAFRSSKKDRNGVPVRSAVPIEHFCGGTKLKVYAKSNSYVYFTVLIYSTL